MNLTDNHSCGVIYVTEEMYQIMQARLDVRDE